MQGQFIVIEGVDGAGKSSHIQSMVNLLKTYHREVTLTREPGGTPLGEKLREMLLNEDMDRHTETLLMYAARNEHVKKVIHPALSNGNIVLSDRFNDSSYAYQCGGRGIHDYKINVLNDWVLQGFEPDLVIFFDLPPEISVERLKSARAPDKFEKLDVEFFHKVRNQYLKRIEDCKSEKYQVINANQPIEKVWDDVKGVVQRFMAVL